MLGYVDRENRENADDFERVSLSVINYNRGTFLEHVSSVDLLRNRRNLFARTYNSRLLESERVHIIRASLVTSCRVGASLKSIPARSLLSVSFSFLSLAIVVSIPLSFPSLSRHGREGGGTAVGVAPSYVSGLACEAKDETCWWGPGRRNERAGGREKARGRRKFEARGEGVVGTIRGRLRL